MDDNVEQVLLTFIRENCLPQGCPDTLGLNDHLFETGIIDSAGLINFISYIEAHFGIEIPDEDLVPENFTTIAAITAYVREHRNGAATITREVDP